MDTPVELLRRGRTSRRTRRMNYDREFEGPITLRRALEQSRNVPGRPGDGPARPEAGDHVRAPARARVAAAAVSRRSRSAPPKRR